MGGKRVSEGAAPAPQPNRAVPCGAPQPLCTVGTLQCRVTGVEQEESWGKAGDSVHWQQELSLGVS